MTDPFVDFDAAHALGALDDADAASYEAHLSGCDGCRDRLARARSTVALLNRAGAPAAFAAEPLDTVGPPPTLLPVLLRRARLERRRRTRFTAAVAGLAAACLVALAWVGWDATRGDAPGGSRPVALTALHGARVQATAVLAARPWGTEITVHCRYADGVTGYRPYRLVVIDDTGADDDAGSWQLGPGQDIDYVGGTAVPRARIAKVQVTDGAGTPILQLVL